MLSATGLLIWLRKLNARRGAAVKARKAQSVEETQRAPVARNADRMPERSREEVASE